MPSHQDRREPLPKGYQFGDARLSFPGRDSLRDYMISEKLDAARARMIRDLVGPHIRRSARQVWTDITGSDGIEGVPV